MFALVVLVGSLASYAFHARAYYEEVDRALVAAVRAARQGRALGELVPPWSRQLDVPLVIRHYQDGHREEGGAGRDPAPPVDPRAVLARPSGPAYGFFPSLAPSVTPIPDEPGAFGTLHDEQQRWRAFVHVVSANGAAGTTGGSSPEGRASPAAPPGQQGVEGYVVALAPLGGLDASMADYRRLLAGTGFLGFAVAVLGSWAVAGSALRPIARLTDTARAIAASRDLSRRVHAAGRDELSLLATTFNEMLDSVETAYQLQQRFVADASHELRAPMTVILGNLDLVLRQPNMPADERAEALLEARREAERLSRLVADLLALARADSGIPLTRQPLDLDAVVLDAFHEARALAEGQTLLLEPFEPVQVTGDSDRLKQLLLILLDNAIKYTPAGGRITVGLRTDGPWAEMVVRDTGVGIPPQDLPHVFERFYRADPARSRDPGGTGLGLSIARWIVEQHGGHITLDSQPGRGTEVRVRLPRRG